MQGKLKALERVGLVHMLAEPNLTAVCGETAKFLAGGEFPVPVSRDRDGNVTVEFKQFGVGLSFTPVVLAPGRISLQISTEVSELTNTGAFTLTGAASSQRRLTIPALTRAPRRRPRSNCPPAAASPIAGLMQHNTKQVIDGFPGVKDMPVLGALFRSRDLPDDQTELVVLVSAYLVEPDVGSGVRRAHRRLRRSDRSRNPAAGPPERDLQEERREAAVAAGIGARRLHRALGGRHDDSQQLFRVRRSGRRPDRRAAAPPPSPAPTASPRTAPSIIPITVEPTIAT